MRLANVDNGKIDRNYSGPTDFVYSTALSANGKLAVGGGQDSTLYVWRVDDGGLVRSLPAPKPEDQQQTAQAGGGN